MPTRDLTTRPLRAVHSRPCQERSLPTGDPCILPAPHPGATHLPAPTRRHRTATAELPVVRVETTVMPAVRVG